MTRMHSILGLVSVLASALALGCSQADTSERSAENEMRLEGQSVADQDGYGYEMVPLELKTDAVAPVGNSPMLNGGVAPEELVRQATARIGDLRSCYANAYALDSTLSGEVRAISRFQANGNLISLQLQSDLSLSPAFKNCLTAALNTMQLPASSGGMLTVYYPITLDPALLSTQN